MSGIFRTYDVEYFTFGSLHQTTFLSSVTVISADVESVLLTELLPVKRVVAKRILPRILSIQHCKYTNKLI